MKPEQFVEKLNGALGERLVSVVLYGSAAGGDHVEKRSDFNLLVVARALGMEELRAIASVTGAWTRAGNPPPLMFTLDRLRKSADTFPLELLDLKQMHRILHGEDVVQDVEVSRENLRRQLEYELKSTLIQLREAYLGIGGKTKRVAALLKGSISTVLVLFRGALRLYEDEAIPDRKLDALDALANHIEFDRSVFQEVEALRVGEARDKGVDADALFDRYVRELEQVVDAVDDFDHNASGGTKDE